jgi:hypothetical protein
MDEQNPRVNADEMRGRGDDRTTGYAAGERIPAGPAAESETARTREIRREIAHTRGELSETVNAIQDRLRPSNLASEATQSVKEAAMNKAREVGDSEPVIYARSNPIPSAMVGIGLIGAAWLAFAGRDDRSYYARRTAGSTWRDRESYRSGDYSGAGYPERRGGAAYSSEGYAARRQEAGSGYERSALDRAGHRGSAMLPDTDSLRRTWHDNPMLIGAAAVVAGAIVGLSIPETEREHQLMGETRDAMLQNVQDTVREKVDEVQQVASNAVNTVQKIATGESG